MRCSLRRTPVSQKHSIRRAEHGQQTIFLLGTEMKNIRTGTRKKETPKVDKIMEQHASPLAHRTTSQSLKKSCETEKKTF